MWRGVPEVQPWSSQQGVQVPGFRTQGKRVWEHQQTRMPAKERQRGDALVLWRIWEQRSHRGKEAIKQTSVGVLPVDKPAVEPDTDSVIWSQLMIRARQIQ